MILSVKLRTLLLLCGGKRALNLKCTTVANANYGIFRALSYTYVMVKNLSDSPCLGEYQRLIRKLVVERGFDKETVHEVFMLLAEEVGEMSKAIRKLHGVKTDKTSRRHDVEEEAADIFWMLIDLCNRLDINLEKAFREKEIKNQNRNWT